MTIRVRDSEATRGAILDAAEILFVDRGFDAVSLREIAEQAQVTKSLIHHHFVNKKTLWEAVRERRFASYYAVQKQLLSNESLGIQGLLDSIVAYYHWLNDNPMMVRLWQWCSIEGLLEETDMERDLIENGVARLMAAQARGELRNDINPSTVLVIMLGMCNQWFANRQEFGRWYATNCPLSGERHRPKMHDLNQCFVEDMVKIMARGLGIIG